MELGSLLATNHSINSFLYFWSLYIQYAFKYLRLCFSTKLSIFRLYGRIVLPSHLHPTHHRIPFSSHSSFPTPPASPQQGLCQIGSHASSALINFLPIFRLNTKLPLNRFATHRAHFLAPHINTTPQCTIIFAEQTSDSFAIYTVTPL